jgi:hypothetical protein
MILGKKIKVKPNYKKNTFILQYQFSEIYEKAKLEMNKILQLTNNLGWFPSFMTAYNSLNQSKEIKWEENLSSFKSLIETEFTDIDFLFEAKYDIPYTAFPEKMYHICNSNNVDKILKIGLIPRCRSKKSFHPERVYLCKHINQANDLIEAFKILYPNEKYEILEINTVLIEQYLKLFQDPNFIEMGYYTLNNITPWCIKKINT